MQCCPFILAAVVAASATAQPAESPAESPSEFTRRFREFAAASQPEGSNGAELLQSLAPRIERLEGKLVGRDCYFEVLWSDADLDPEERRRQLSRVGDAIAEARESGMLDDMEALAATDNLIPPDLGEWTHDQELDFLRPTRRLARLNAARLVLAFERGDRAEAIAVVRESLWLARRTASLGMRDSLSNGLASELLLLDRVREQVPAGRADAELAAALLGAIDSAMPVAPVTAVYEGRGLLRRRDIALLYNDRGEMVRDRLRASSTTGLDRAHLDPAAPGDPALPGLGQMLAWDDQFAAVLVDIAAALPRERPEIVRRTAEDWNIYDTSTPAGEARIAVYAAFMPGAGPEADFADQLALHLAATRTMLAIEIYRGRHGAPPASLAALAAGTLPEIPGDPYTHAPLVYRADPDAPFGYTLYSPGYDGADDGARRWHEPGHAYKALGHQGAGYDYVFVPAGAAPGPDDK